MSYFLEGTLLVILLYFPTMHSETEWKRFMDINDKLPSKSYSFILNYELFHNKNDELPTKK